MKENFWPTQNIVFETFRRPYGATESNESTTKIKMRNTHATLAKQELKNLFKNPANMLINSFVRIYPFSVHTMDDDDDRGWLADSVHAQMIPRPFFCSPASPPTVQS